MEYRLDHPTLFIGIAHWNKRFMSDYLLSLFSNSEVRWFSIVLALVQKLTNGTYVL
jgi:hypothetical protein